MIIDISPHFSTFANTQKVGVMTVHNFSRSIMCAIALYGIFSSDLEANDMTSNIMFIM